MKINVPINDGLTSGVTKKFIITSRNKPAKNPSDEVLYKELVKQYGVPETDRWGIQTFEFTPECYQFVREGESEEYIQRKHAQYMGSENEAHIYLKKGKKLDKLKEYKPSQ
jgi:hypothetical protein